MDSGCSRKVNNPCGSNRLYPESNDSHGGFIMENLYVGKVVMDKITKALLKVTWFNKTQVELYNDKTKSHERFSKEWFNDLFNQCDDVVNVSGK